MKTGRFVAIHVLTALVALSWPTLLPAQTGGDEVEIKDNSFFVEEAYNQEAGVVQHIFNWVPAWERNAGGVERTFDFVFTQEWPVFSQTHQISYTIPLSSFRNSSLGDPATSESGPGDILLNYRLQVLDGEDEPFAFAPRFSLIFPSGDPDKGLGNGRLGYQVNLPFSKDLEKWAFHFNSGLTVTPNVGPKPPLGVTGVDRTLNGYNLGVSAIYKLRPAFHLMLESVALWDETFEAGGQNDKPFQAIVSPGFRWAVFTRGDTQCVFGAAVPIGASRDAANIGAFFYLSFEHRFLPKDADE